MIPRRTSRLQWALCLLLVLGNAALQFATHGPALDDGIENRSSPASTDSRDYARRAALLAGGDFTAAFGDGYRTPGYPAFLAAFSPLRSPFRAARCAQVLLTAAMALMAFLTLRNLFGKSGGPGPAGWKALGGAALVAAWPPLYYFSPLLLAEACSLFALSALLWILSWKVPDASRPRSAAGAVQWIGAALLLAFLVLLKPNHVLLLLPVTAFLWMRGRRSRALACGLLTLALLAPWSAFVSWKNQAPVFLSTASGVNLYLGTGVVQSTRDAGSLPYEFARKAGMIRDSAAGDRTSAAQAGTARAIWSDHPLRTSLYGVSKVLHGFGFSLRGVRDAALLALLAAALFFSARLWRRKDRTRDEAAWTLLFWAVLLVTVFQLFVYLPNQRLKTVLFDYPALLIVGYGLLCGRPRSTEPRDAP